MKRGFNLYLYLILLSLAGFAGLFYIRTMDAVKSASRDGYAMDTVVRVSISVPRGSGKPEEILDDVFSLIGELDALLSMHNAGSDVARINAEAGIAPARVREETFSAIKSAKEWAAVTEGWFDPTIGAISTLWDIAGHSASEDLTPSDERIAEALKTVGYEGLDLIDPNEVYLANRGAEIDLGGIAKGYASQRVQELLKAGGVRSALADLGGNVVLIGGRPNGEPWRIGIQHPYEKRGVPLCALSVYGTSIITAGVYERFAEVDGKRYTHIFNPRTGHPIDGELLSVTVISPDPVAGDALSTAFIAMGQNRSIDLLRVLPGIEAVFVSKDGEGGIAVTATGGLRDVIEVTGADLEIAFIDLLG